MSMSPEEVYFKEVHLAQDLLHCCTAPADKHSTVIWVRDNTAMAVEAVGEILLPFIADGRASHESSCKVAAGLGWHSDMDPSIYSRWHVCTHEE